MRVRCGSPIHVEAHVLELMLLCVYHRSVPSNRIDVFRSGVYEYQVGCTVWHTRALPADRVTPRIGNRCQHKVMTRCAS